MASDWKSDISFSDRFGNIIKIQDALQSAKPGEDAGEIQTEARNHESSAYETATSLSDYSRVIEDYMQSFHVTTDVNLPVNSSNDDSLYCLPSGGITLGRYSNAHHHRDGLLSSVFKAYIPADVTFEEPVSSPLVALKVTHPSSSTAPHDPERECRLLLQAKSNYVIPLLEIFQQSGGRLVLAFPFMPYDLGQLLEDGRLSETQKVSCLQDIFRGLAHVHDVGIIHRDIKPSNVLLLTPSGPAFIADFGIAWADRDPSSEPTDAKILDVGSTSYRPPELLFGSQKYGRSLDLWAAGCVVAQVVSLGAKTLFDSGDLGSELALIKSIFQTLGTPNVDIWPEAAQYPDWGKMTFYDYPAKLWVDTLPRASDKARDLVDSLVRYESGERLSAKQALEHAYLV